MRYIFWGIVFAIFTNFITQHSKTVIFGFICGLLFAEIISLRKRISSLEKISPILYQTPKHSIKPQATQTQEHDAQSQEYVAQTQELHAQSQEHDAQSQEYVAQTQELHAQSQEYVVQSQEHDAQSHKRKEKQAKISNREDTVKINFFTRVITRIKEFFTTGNVVLKLGIIIIFFGISFLLKYAAQHNYFPIELRLVSVAVFAIAMLITGWSMINRRANKLETSDELEKADKLEKNESSLGDAVFNQRTSKEHRLEYGLVLQGGGVGILYLTVFAASKLYNLLPNTFSLAVMLMLVTLSCALAVMQDAKSLALSGIIGGFLAPILMSTGSGSHIMLFSYYALLNCGILTIAWFKAWRELNLVGFIFTFIISALWGREHYEPELFSTTEPFLILFFLFYVAISVLFAHRQPPKLKGFIDGALVFGLPLVCFGLQSSLVENIEYGLAISALSLGLFYITLATILWNRLVEGMRMLTEAFLALGIVFGSLAIPLALDGRWTATAWAIEGAAMVWVGIRQNRLAARLFGILLQFGAGIAFLTANGFPYNHNSYYTASNGMIFLNQTYLGSVFISIGGLFSSYYLASNTDKLTKWEKYFHIPLILWGLIWWFGGGLNEIKYNFYSAAYLNEYNLFLLYSAVSCQIMSIVAKKYEWNQLLVAMMGFLPLIFCTLILELFDLYSSSHLFSKWGAVAWIAVFSVQYRILWQLDERYGLELEQEDGINNALKPELMDKDKGQDENKDRNKWCIILLSKLIPLWHIITLWILIFIISHETVWGVRRLFNQTSIDSFELIFGNSLAWSAVFWGIVPAIFILFIIQKGEFLKWPVLRHSLFYYNQGLSMPAFFLMFWILATNFYDGNPDPLPYFPVVNPLELSQIFVLIVLFIWAFRDIESKRKQIFLLILIFIWLNFVTGRFVHFYFNVPFEFDNLSGSVVFQASISILWGVISLITTAFATRTSRRKMWFVGAALLGLLVLKLFTVDLSGIKTVARIVSFLAVGGLMLLIGYLSPIPPKEKKE